jgi:hypothetical protein
LTGSEKTARTWWNSQQETWAECQEEGRGHNQVGLCQNETHRLRDETVDKEEDECVEHSGHLRGLSVQKIDFSPVGGQENTWAESQKKSSWDGDFLGCDIGEHGLIYRYIILYTVLSYKSNPVIKCSTNHNFIVHPQIIYVFLDTTPNV